ncbi:hypothetical protein N0V93_008920 [Gnomoniopsis smithogilvyi]|uniref:Uncharacterized protein n=1 Tax=Gnomoniopsis smithogilvyi TaxID=1191159 RepID=A0A9W8YIQ4_9PEZI|nr:hypothetical protein N0V93_008920 [Gnomoniopsis smithogilvyi]
MFHQHGTGEIILIHEARAWIGAQTEWKCLDGAAILNRDIPCIVDGQGDASAQDRARNNLIADISMEITITKRVITSRGTVEGLDLNEFYLKDQAFTPKRYFARLESGTFMTTMEEKLKAIPPWTPRFKYRLSFDTSPYPQSEDWKDFDEDEQYLLPQPFLPYSEWKEFCSVQLPGEAQAESK